MSYPGTEKTGYVYINDATSAYCQACVFIADDFQIHFITGVREFLTALGYDYGDASDRDVLADVLGHEMLHDWQNNYVKPTSSGRSVPGSYSEGTARFVDEHTLGVSGDAGSERRLTAENVVVASGSEPAHPKDIAFNGTTILDSDDIVLRLARIPALKPLNQAIPISWWMTLAVMTLVFGYLIAGLLALFGNYRAADASARRKVRVVVVRSGR